MARVLSGAAGGAILLVFGLFLFAVQDNIIKYLSDTYSALQIVFIRGVVSAILMLPLLYFGKTRIPVISSKPLLVFIRGSLGFCSYLCYYLAIAAMPLAEVVAITFTMPLFVTILSALVLGERVGIRRWSAIGIGFLGVMVMVSPQGDFNLLAVLLAFGASLTYATHTIITRYLGQHDNPMTIAFDTVLVFTFWSVVLSLSLLLGLMSFDNTHESLNFLSRDWVKPAQVDFSLMLLLGVIAAVGFYCLSRAYCVSEASAIAPFEFTYLIWAVVFGLLIWGEIPSPQAMLGIIVLVSSSLYVWHRERVLQRSPKQTQEAVITLDAQPVK